MQKGGDLLRLSMHIRLPGIQLRSVMHLALLLALLLLQLHRPGLTARAEELFYDESLYYTVTADNEIRITGARASLTEITIPASIDGLPVTLIGDYAFSGCTRLVSLALPDTIRSIGAFAFENCRRLETLNIPPGVTSIGAGAVTGTPWLASQPEEYVIAGQGILLGCRGTQQTAQIPYGVRIIAGYAFDSSSITAVQMPDSLRRIEGFAFNNCRSLTQVSFSNSLEYIGEYAFHWCIALSEIALPDSLRTLGNHAFCYCKQLAQVRLSSRLDVIPNSAFANCTALRSVEGGQNLREIQNNAFQNCLGIQTACMPAGFGDLGNNVFSGCKNLKAITFYAYADRIYNSENAIPAWAQIIGLYGSSAHVYAHVYSRAFTALDIRKGDIDLDTELSTDDAFNILTVFAVRASAVEFPLPPRQEYAGDFDSSGIIDTEDAMGVLEIFALHGSGMTVPSQTEPKEFYLIRTQADA